VNLSDKFREGIEKHIKSAMDTHTKTVPIIAQNAVLNSWWFRALLLFVLGSAPVWLTLKISLSSIEKKLDQASPTAIHSAHP
jgi:hypothetical protein